MTKSDLITALALRIKVSQKQATNIINLIFDGFADSLEKGERTEIRGFGTFSVRKYRAYKRRNPKTGKDIDMKPKKMAFFKVGKKLKKRVDI